RSRGSRRLRPGRAPRRRLARDGQAAAARSRDGLARVCERIDARGNRGDARLEDGEHQDAAVPRAAPAGVAAWRGPSMKTTSAMTECAHEATVIRSAASGAWDHDLRDH